jgi:hypothetical protein
LAKTKHVGGKRLKMQGDLGQHREQFETLVAGGGGHQCVQRRGGEVQPFSLHPAIDRQRAARDRAGAQWTGFSPVGD